MISGGLNGKTFQLTTKVNQNYKPTDCDTPAIFYTMCQQPLILKTMEKLYFKTTGQEPDVNCIEPCKYEDRPSEGTMIGSGDCQDCRACYGWDCEENWVKCLNYSMEKQGLHVRLA